MTMPREQATKLPKWVKGFVWAGLAAAIALAIILASGHGPWQHMNMSGMH